jgi:hypothetical protein
MAMYSSDLNAHSGAVGDQPGKGRFDELDEAQ